MSWRSYRHRFVPWVFANWKSRAPRRTTESAEQTKRISAGIVESLVELCGTLQHTETAAGPKCCHDCTYGCRYKLSGKLRYSTGCSLKDAGHAALSTQLGFHLAIEKSSLPGAGRGVFLKEGFVKKGQLVALYPGAVYQCFQPIFFQSLGNPYVLRCVDGVLVDGGRGRLSTFLFRSCWHRDKIGHHPPADVTWLSDTPINPLAIGQIVNNHSDGLPANVAYEEANLLVNFPLEYRCFVPNLNHQPLACVDDSDDSVEDIATSKRVWVRVVGLLALRDINPGEEILSSYMTEVVSSS